MNILNSFSKLNSYKIHNGIKIAKANVSSVYISEAKIKKYLMKHQDDESCVDTLNNIRIHKCINKLEYLTPDQISKVLHEIQKENTFDNITTLIYELPKIKRRI